MKKALITGITGQDGSYLAEWLLSKGYEVHGVIRRSSSFNTGRIDHIFNRLNLHYGEVTDASNMTNLVRKIKPNEVYNLAAQSHVMVSFELPMYTAQSVFLSNMALLEAIRHTSKNIRFYQASSSEMYGSASGCFNRIFKPKSPYGVAKLAAYWNTINYRDGYDLFACNGILFNHESPRRGKTFVTKKIIDFLVNWTTVEGKGTKLELGNLDSARDFGFAPDYVIAMWSMLQAPHPSDYTIGTGVSYTVMEFLKMALEYMGIEYKTKGKEAKTVIYLEQYDSDKGGYFLAPVISINEKYFRPNEIDRLTSYSSRANTVLGWKPFCNIKDLIAIMVDFEERRRNLKPKGRGLEVAKEYGWTTIQ